MVTRIYTPPVMSYYRAQQLQHQQKEDSAGQALAEQQTAQTNQYPQQTQQNAFSTPSASPSPQDTAQQQHQQSKLLLASAKQAQRIPMGTILQDFTSTLNALGVDEPTKNEVNAYLGVVAMQAGKGNPDIGFIKQSLRTAAGTLDSYISNALQQPSNVVKDWVDALLLQPIDYHLDERERKAANLSVQAHIVPGEKEETEAQEITVQPLVEKLSPNQLQDIKDALQTSKTAYQDGDLRSAKTTLLNIQRQLPENSPAIIQGRISLQLGKIAQEQHQYTDAQQYYQKAIDAFRENPNAKGKLAQSFIGLAETYEAQGNWPKAQQSFEQGLTLTQHLPALAIQARNGLGNSLLQQQQPEQALGQFLGAYQLAQVNPGQTSELPDALSNMGRVYQELNQFNKSEKAYRLALKYAKQGGDLDSYRATLVQLSALYSQSQNTDGYQQVINRLEGLSG